MIYINQKNKIKDIDFSDSNNYYIVADFDKTLTEGNSNSTWAVMANANGVNEEYTRKRNELYNIYRAKEIDMTLSEEEKSKYMEEWWQKHISLFFEYGLEEKAVKNSIKNGGLKFREGAREFLEKMRDMSVPVIIISAGIGNVIEEFLNQEDAYFENIFVLSNFVKFKEGVIEKIEGETIHSLNKNVVRLPKEVSDKLIDKKNILLLGDGIADLKMVKTEDLKRTVTVGFLDEKIEENLEYYNKEFDIVLTNQSSFDDVNKILNLYK